MIISRTPFRISFFGGGTDYPGWYKENPGSVLSATINKYCYISCRYLPPFFDYKYLIRYFHREEVKFINDIQHPSVRECLRFLDMHQGIEMVHTADIPALSGCGSSSAFTVGFLNTVYALQGKMVGKRQLAQDAIVVEQDLIQENVGAQDQVAVAFGGLNRIDFGGEDEFLVTPVTVSKKRVNDLQSHLMLFFSGFARKASEIASEQVKQIFAKSAQLNEMRQMVDEAVNIVNSDADIIDFGKLLDQSWQLKKTLSKKITTSAVDEMYSKAINAGALGGKLCGAGGGGFMLLFVEPDKQAQVKLALKDYLYVPFSFENQGSQIIMYSPEREMDDFGINLCL